MTMRIFGPSDKDILVLLNWARNVGARLQGESLFVLRHEWVNAGGQLPPTEAQAEILMPKPTNFEVNHGKHIFWRNHADA